MKTLHRRLIAGAIATCLTFQQAAMAKKNPLSLEDGFKSPPAYAKPQTWLHAMSGNMSKVGLTKDLEAIAEVGIGGIMIFNVAQGVPYGKVKFNSDRHIELMGHAAKESKRLGIDFGMHNCDGWTSSGGPWVSPENSMKKVVWTKTLVKGGKVDISVAKAEALHDYYEDIALIAYPTLETEKQDQAQKPSITSSDKKFDTSIVQDGSIKASTKVRIKEGEKGWVQFTFKKPFTLRGALILIDEGRRSNFTLQTSNNGKDFTTVKKLHVRGMGKKQYGLDPVFDGIKAKHFRLLAEQTFKVQEAKLSASPTFGDMLGRTSRGRTHYGNFSAMGQAPQDLVIKSSSIIDLSASLKRDGRLSVKLPAGDWTLLRMGFTTTGATNSPASTEGKGLEVDKFSRKAFKIHYDQFVKRVVEEADRVAPGAFKYVEIDSYEVGGQNWTHNYDKIFKKRFGYDLIAYLPLYTGLFVDSADKSELVLNNLRQLNSELMVENYFKYFTELAHADGLKTYLEPYGNGPFNDMDAGAQADIPMGEFWLNRNLRTIASVASTSHINNKNLVSAEGFTSRPEVNWKFHPGMAKLDGDKMHAMGINEFVFHRFAHQANTHVMPGMIMGKWGANLDRTQPWWGSAVKSWVSYLTRNQFMLRQGLPAADMLMFIGDGHPSTCLDRRRINPKLPTYLNYDCVTPDVLKTRFKAKGKRLVLPEGTSYKVLYLTNNQEMTLSTLRVVNKFSKAGVVVVGEAPTKLLATSWQQKVSDSAFEEFSKLVNAIWGRKTTYTEPLWNRIFELQKFNFGFRAKGNDHLLYSRRKTKDADIYFIVNTLDEANSLESHFDVAGKIPELWKPMTGEIKKLGAFSHKNDKTVMQLNLAAKEAVFVVFREKSKGRKTLAHTAKSGDITNVLVNASDRLIIEADANGAYKLPNGKTMQVSSVPKPQTIAGTWKLRFNPYYGFGETLLIDNLFDWKDHANENIKYYTGTATYSNTFTLGKDFVADNARVMLDLGQVSVSASVVVNSQDVGVAWVKPFKLDITDAVKQGKNTITIEVANLWTNRLIGDKRHADTSGYQPTQYFPKPDSKMPAWYVNNEPPPPGKRITFATHQFYQKGDPLVSSGLLGPVRVSAVASVPVTGN